MTIDYSEFDEYSWEYNAWHLIRQHDMDVPHGSRSTFEDLYKGEKFALLANKAWNELRARNVEWTIADMVGLLASKQHDYGHANIEMFGVSGVRVRLWDKIARFENLVKRDGEWQHEAIEDTLKDMVGYVVIYFMVRDGSFSYVLHTDFGPPSVAESEAKVDAALDDLIDLAAPDKGEPLYVQEYPAEDDEWVEPTYGKDEEPELVPITEIIPVSSETIQVASPPPPDLKNDIPKAWKLSQEYV